MDSSESGLPGLLDSTDSRRLRGRQLDSVDSRAIRCGGAKTTPVLPDEFGYRASPSACEAAADDVVWTQKGENRFRLGLFTLPKTQTFELCPFVFGFLSISSQELWAGEIKDWRP